VVTVGVGAVFALISPLINRRLIKK